MKKIKLILVLIITLFSFNLSVLADSSNFESNVSMDLYVTENQLTMILGFTGEEVMAINQKLSYDKTKLKLVDVIAMDNFKVTTSKEKTEANKYSTLTVLADSDYSFNSSNYCVLKFEVTNKFKTGSSADVFVYNIEAVGPSKEKYRSTGNVININRSSVSEIDYVTTPISSSTKTKYWFINHIFLLGIILIIVIAIVILLALIPSKRKKEKREEHISNMLKPENYKEASQNQIQKTPEELMTLENKNVNQVDIQSQNVMPVENMVKETQVVNQSMMETLENPQIQNQNAVSGLDNNPIDVFNQRKPEDYEETQIKEVENQVVKEVEVQNNSDLTIINPMNFEVADVNNMPPVENNSINPFDNQSELKEITPVPLESADNQVSDNSQSELTVINPQTFEDVNTELPKIDTNIQDNNNNNNANMFGIIILILLSFACTLNVKAEEFRPDDVRLYIVGKIAFDKELDYNKDGIIDIKDLIETKNLNNCNFEKLMKTDSGFAEIHAKSNNLISTDEDFTTTKKGKKTTTTKEKTTKSTTSKNNAGNFVTKSTTAKTSTNKETTTKKTTTTKATATSYIVNINATNGSVNPSNTTVKQGYSATINLTPNSGYTITKENINCTNASFSLGNNKLVLSKITGNVTCNLTFTPTSGVKITLKYINGKGVTGSGVTYSGGTSKTGTGTYNQLYTYDIATPAGYKVASGSPDCGSYSNGVFSITVPATNTTCTLKFEPIQYSINSAILNTTIYYGESRKIEFTSETKYRKATCGSKTITVYTTANGDETYTNKFTYKHEITENITCTFS